MGATSDFLRNGKLRKLDVASSTVQTLCDAPEPRGGAWNRNGLILFSPTAASPLYSISADGGVPSQVTALDPTGKEISDRWPHFLPDGRQFLYMGYKPGGTRLPIWLGSLDSKDKKQVFESISMVEYAAPGYLIYVREHSLVARNFGSTTWNWKATHSLWPNPWRLRGRVGSRVGHPSARRRVAS